MLKKLTRTTPKKIKIARKVYETYCKVNSLKKTREATGLAIYTIRKYIALIEEINNKNKISKKDRYYSDNKDINKEDVNKIKDSSDIDIREDAGKTDNDINDIEVINTNNIPDLKDTKNRILHGKLDTIAFKYLEYLDNPSERQLLKTSLKDRAVIAGILLDKKIQLEHKQGDIIRNQSMIFNLFGSNDNLASFIASSMKRQQALKDRPVKKYVPAVNK